VSRSVEWPIAIRSVDVARPLEPLSGLSRYSRVRIFISHGDTLLGSVDVWHRGADTVSASRLIDAIAERHHETLFQHALRQQIEGESAPSMLPPTSVSIIVPTCDRPDDLRRLLESLLRQHTRHQLEIIVVDNRPASGRTRAAVASFPAVRLVEEHRPGLSYARNAGILRATGSIVVATDDDVTAPATWIEKLVEPFSRPEVMAVTGHVLPLQLETEAQCRFEAYGGLGKGFAPFEADSRWLHSTRDAAPTWRLGATANAAFRASVFRDPAVGLMHEALGAGMPTGCSEDSYLFYRVLKAGGTLVYEPSAWVWHRHRESMDSLRRQIRAYSTGHVAYHLVTLMADGDRRALIRLLYSLPRHLVVRAVQRVRRHSDYPLSLIALEILGNLMGPIALWRSLMRVRRLGPSAPAPLPKGHDALPLEGQAT
jgi:GT2 family glycosyltransferase